MTKRTTTTARLCRFRKETERQAAACSTRRQDRLFVPVAAGKKRQACEARDQARSRANTDNDVGGRSGAAGDQVVVVRGGGMRTSRVAHAAADHLPTLVNQPSHFPPHWTIPVFLPPFGRRNTQEKRSLFWDEGRLRESCELRWSPSTNKRGGATKKKTKISDIKKITSAATKKLARGGCASNDDGGGRCFFLFSQKLCPSAFTRACIFVAMFFYLCGLPKKWQCSRLVRAQNFDELGGHGGEDE